MTDTLEALARRAVRARLKRGRRAALAAAAGHADGSWVSNWLSGVQKHATIDEIAAMLREVGTSLDAVIAERSRAANADIIAALADGQTAAQLRAFLKLPAPVKLMVLAAPPAVALLGSAPSGESTPAPTRGAHTRAARGRRQ